MTLQLHTAPASLKSHLNFRKIQVMNIFSAANKAAEKHFVKADVYYPSERNCRESTSRSSLAKAFGARNGLKDILQNCSPKD